MYTILDYREHYEDCKKSLELIKNIVKREALKEVLPSPATKELRESLIRLFSKPEFSQVCKNCKGDCCITRNFHLAPFELFCFIIDNPNFVFPEPDWQFLEEELRRNKLLINNRCLFLKGYFLYRLRVMLRQEKLFANRLFKLQGFLYILCWLPR